MKVARNESDQPSIEISKIGRETRSDSRYLIRNLKASNPGVVYIMGVPGHFSFLRPRKATFEVKIVTFFGHQDIFF